MTTKKAVRKATLEQGKLKWIGPGKLTDFSLMPFGKYEGQPMGKVPASYLHYLWCAGLKDETRGNVVARYIEMNMATLKKDHPDGVW